jgi:ribonuclease D
MQELFIDTPAGLQELCQRLRGQPVLALDTEFLREKTYYAQLCLLQIAAEDLIACVDPLALADLGPLLEIIYDPTVTKVMHSARQDLDILFDLRGALPRPLFDTQIAATLLGYGDQLGYAALVKDLQGVELDKAHTRTDWSQRPLDDAQLHYAADDVRYLLPIYQQQRARLEAMGRLAWLQKDFDELTDPALYAPPESELWKRVRGTQKLRGRQLAILQGLAAWREQQARRSNRPRRWVLKDEVMVDLARRGPETLAEMEKIRGLEAKTLQRHGAALLEVMAQARQLPAAQWPSRPEGRRLQPIQEGLVDVLMALVRTRGVEQEVSPQLLASRKELEAVVAGSRDCAVLHGWRNAVVGAELLAVLNGELAVQITAGRLEAVERGG